MKTEGVEATPKLSFWDVFNNPGLLLFTIYAAGRKIKLDRIFPYAWLLKQTRIVPFGYGFYFNSLPQSNKGYDDLFDLVELKEIRMLPDGYIEVTETGKEWAERHKTREGFDTAVEAIRKAIDRYEQYDYLRLYNECIKAGWE